MSDTIGTSAPGGVGDRMGERIEQVCHDIDELLETLREQARKLREIGDDE